MCVKNPLQATVALGPKLSRLFRFPGCRAVPGERFPPPHPHKAGFNPDEHRPPQVGVLRGSVGIAAEEFDAEAAERGAAFAKALFPPAPPPPPPPRRRPHDAALARANLERALAHRAKARMAQRAAEGVWWVENAAAPAPVAAAAGSAGLPPPAAPPPLPVEVGFANAADEPGMGGPAHVPCGAPWGVGGLFGGPPRPAAESPFWPRDAEL